MKTKIANYTFDASAKTVEFDDYATVRLDGVLIIVNVTDQIIIYNFADSAKGGTAATNILTLEFDTTAMSDTDDLLIYYDDEAIEAPLTDTELRATPVPVSGTVTATTGGLTDAQLRATPVPVSGTVTASGPLTDTQLRATAVPVSLATVPSHAVTGPLTDTELRATAVPVSGTVAVTGVATAANQATEIASLAAIAAKDFSTETTLALIKAKTDNLDVALSTRTKPADAQHVIVDSGVTTGLTDAQLRATAVPVSGTITAVTAITNALPAGTNAIGKLAANSGVDIGDVDVASITPPTLTKGTQDATGFSTQDLKDAGRVSINCYAIGAAAGTTGTETAITLTQSRGTGATSAAASFVITSGKRFRIQSIRLYSRGNAVATTQATTFSFRINTAGAVTTSSTPIVFQVADQTAAAGGLSPTGVGTAIPDGFEILGDGTLQWGLTANAVYVTNAPTWNVHIIGYEY